jgi:hypothetical protein
VAPFGLCLIAARLAGQERPWQALAWLAGGALLLGFVYWQRVLPARLKQELLARVYPSTAKRVIAPAAQPGDVH